MPVIKYDYRHSTLDSDRYVETLNREISDFCKAHPDLTEKDKKALLSRLLRRAGMAAHQGVDRDEGGPFGALIADFNTADGIPRVVGFGTNHVVPNNDPSAHAEMTAIRDTAKRIGRTDLSGLTLITSCECCPMCLSAATGCKIDKVYYAATRDDAADVGFSDADQYRLMRLEGGIDHHAKKISAEEAEAVLHKHDAAVIVPYQGRKLIHYGDYVSANPKDPTDLPVVQAIKNACRALSALTGEKIFHLPEDTQLISRQKPHPMSLVVADWARIGRVRGADASDPSQDSPQKNTARISYVYDNQPEQMSICNGIASEQVDPERVWEEIRNPTSVHVGENLGHARLAAFEKWDQKVNAGAKRY